MKKTLCSIAFVTIGLFSFYFVSQHNKATLPKHKVNLPVLVEQVRVSSKIMPTNIHAIGSTESLDRIELTPEVPGHISKILFTAGHHIKKGQTLIELENRAFINEVSVAESHYHLSQLDYNRTKTLHSKSLASTQALDTALANLKEKEATLKEKQLQLEKTRLIAPFSGTLGERKISVGQYVKIGDALLTLSNLDELKIKYSLPEKNISTVKLNQTVHIRSDAFPNQQFKGRVTFISPTVNPSTRTLSVEATMPNTKHGLPSGLFVKITQETSMPHRELVIPEESLISQINGYHVFINQNHKAHLAKVTIKDHLDGYVVIDTGLHEGDQVITRGHERLKEGSTLKLKG